MNSAMMDLSLIDEKFLEADDSFFIEAPETMDDEVESILRKWNSGKIGEPSKQQPQQEEVFDSRTYTRPKGKVKSRLQPSFTLEPDLQPTNLVETPPSRPPMFMQRSWLNDVSPPSSIGASMASIDFQNGESMLNSLITSGDFSNVSFLLNGNADNDTLRKIVPPEASPQLMDFTYDVNGGGDKTFLAIPANNGTFIAKKDNTIEFKGNDITFTQFDPLNKTWSRPSIASHELNATITQSTPIHCASEDAVKLRKGFDHTLSPISSHNEENGKSFTTKPSRKLVDDITIDAYRNSLEDQCEFLLNEETIKLSTKVYGKNETFDCLEIKNALNQSAEKDFDKILDSFDVKKSIGSEKMLQSLDSIKQRHSLINIEKQREEKQQKDCENDNKNQYGTMNISSERLLRRSRLYDDVNLQLQKSQAESPERHDTEHFAEKNLTTNVEDEQDRFKTIKLNKKLQSGMVIVDPVESQDSQNGTQPSPGTNKELRNKLNQMKQDSRETAPVPETKSRLTNPSGLSKFGFSRPMTYRKNELDLPLKVGSTDCLEHDNDLHPNQVKSPMGVKSKSIHNLMFNNKQPATYGLSKLGSARSQSNLKMPRPTSYIAKANADHFKIPSTLNNITAAQARANSSRKSSLVRPSSGYYGNTFTSKRVDSDTESGCSLSSSSASSKNSSHVSGLNLHSNQSYQTSMEPAINTRGAIPKPSGLKPPSNLRAPQARSGLPRPSAVKR